jgi:hypothetical protein
MHRLIGTKAKLCVSGWQGKRGIGCIVSALMNVPPPDRKQPTVAVITSRNLLNEDKRVRQLKIMLNACPLEGIVRLIEREIRVCPKAVCHRYNDPVGPDLNIGENFKTYVQLSKFIDWSAMRTKLGTGVPVRTP